MAITNTAKPSAPSLTNTARVVDYETWASNTTTWATETRTWAEMGSSMDNTDKPRSLGSYTFDEIGNLQIDEAGGAMSDSSFMINTPKP